MKQSKKKLIDTNIDRLEILVSYEEEVIKHPNRIEECFGLHSFIEDELVVTLTYVEIVVPNGKAIDILPMLNDKQKEFLIKAVSNE